MLLHWTADIYLNEVHNSKKAIYSFNSLTFPSDNFVSLKQYVWVFFKGHKPPNKFIWKLDVC